MRGERERVNASKNTQENKTEITCEHTKTETDSESDGFPGDFPNVNVCDGLVAEETCPSGCCIESAV